MKRFTVPCDFNGVKHPFHVYIGEPHPKKHPLQFQAWWLSTERGGTIPQDVMDSFEKLFKISQENNVSFEDLCVYALGTAAEENTEAVSAAPPQDPAPQDDQATNDSTGGYIDPMAENPVPPPTATSHDDPFAPIDDSIDDSHQEPGSSLDDYSQPADPAPYDDDMSILKQTKTTDSQPVNPDDVSILKPSGETPSDGESGYSPIDENPIPPPPPARDDEEC